MAPLTRPRRCTEASFGRDGRSRVVRLALALAALALSFAVSSPQAEAAAARTIALKGGATKERLGSIRVGIDWTMRRTVVRFQQGTLTLPARRKPSVLVLFANLSCGQALAPDAIERVVYGRNFKAISRRVVYKTPKRTIRFAENACGRRARVLTVFARVYPSTSTEKPANAFMEGSARVRIVN